MFAFHLPCRWLATLILATTLSSVDAEEQSPLNLPNQDPVNTVAQPPAVDSRQQYYNQFEQDMSLSTPEWRSALKVEFEKKIRLSKRIEEKEHYRRLLDILAKFH